MDTRTLFQKISQKMRADFEASAQVQHSGSKGTIRENQLRAFLAEGRLPSKYGLGAGEIVGRVRGDTSRQCDLIVYDKLNGVTLLYDESVQVFPIDCVYGIIEVKSSLSKAEFLDALEKIKVLKGMAPGGSVVQPVAGGWTMFHGRPKPFGMVFGYRLAGNSIDSLSENLREWEKTVPPSLWPNYVCVLEAGVIYHTGKSLKDCLDSDEITSDALPISLHHREDSLFQFYCALHDMCAHMVLGPVELRRYYDPAERIGKHIVDGRVELTLTKDNVPPRKVRLTESFLERVIAWCAAKGPMRYEEVLKKQFGSIPVGMSAEALERQVFLYNPNDLPGLHQIPPDAIKRTEHGVAAPPMLANAHMLHINGHTYVIDMSSCADSDFEDVPAA